MAQNGEEKCVICQEAITNPICPACLQREVAHWLADKKPALVAGLRSYTEVFSTYGHKGVRCIICGSDMKICAHCFCKDIYDFLKAEILENTEDFVTSFNFDLNIEAG